MSTRLQSGYTIGELMIVVAVVGVLAVIAVPSLTSFVNQNRLNSVRTLLVNDMNTAKSEAIKRNVRVMICPANGAATDCQSSNDWSTNGWVVCAASGVNCDAASSAVVVRPPATGGVRIINGTANPVIFRPIGTAVTAESLNISGKTGAQSGVVSVATTGFVTYTKN